MRRGRGAAAGWPALSRTVSVLALALALALSLGLAACTGSSSGGPAGSTGSTGDSPQLPSGPRGSPTSASTGGTPVDVPPGLGAFYGQTLRWRGCNAGFDCARLRVPVDYAAPAGATLTLAVVRRQTAGDDRLGSLVLNPGGPGASGVDYARAAESVVSKAVRERYDVVGFDPRGVGRSSPVECLTARQTDDFLAQDGSPDDPAEEQALVRTARDLGRGCEQRTGALAAHVGTADAARDMDVLRAALGDSRLTYLGKSYGTYLGAIYASLFPTRVGRFVLDGVVDPADDTVAIGRAQAAGFQRALGAFVSDCLRRRDCPLAGDRAAGLARIGAFLQDVDGTPLRATRPVTQSLATIGIAEAMYDPRLWGFLRQALRDGFAGNGEALLALADEYARRDEDGRYASNLMVALYAVNCLDLPETSDLAVFRARAVEFSRISPIFGAYVAWGGLPCGYWPVPAQGKAAPVTATGAPPILVVGTTRDPATPYASSVALARELDKGRLLTYDGDGHTAYRQGSSCLDGHVDRFLLQDRLPPVGTRCR